MKIADALDLLSLTRTMQELTFQAAFRTTTVACISSSEKRSSVGCINVSDETGNREVGNPDNSGLSLVGENHGSVWFCLLSHVCLGRAGGRAGGLDCTFARTSTCIRIHIGYLSPHCFIYGQSAWLQSLPSSLVVVPRDLNP